MNHFDMKKNGKFYNVIFLWKHRYVRVFYMICRPIQRHFIWLLLCCVLLNECHVMLLPLFSSINVELNWNNRIWHACICAAHKQSYINQKTIFAQQNKMNLDSPQWNRQWRWKKKTTERRKTKAKITNISFAMHHDHIDIIMIELLNLLSV